MLSPVQFIAQKRDGLAHSAESLRAWVQAYASDVVPDYQMAAWAMAVYLNGMTSDETAILTQSMLESGEVMQWGAGDPVVDKHSTGGIGDKVSLILAPLLACCGLRVPMISGRGLGPTGGTLDKLESIAGFQTQLSTDRIQQITNNVGCVIAGASESIAPADKRLYALRDVTATVASIPLITASIMSKKLSEGLDALVLDVKYGSGAFMKTPELAEQLAHSLVDTGRHVGVSTTAMLTDMNQPLGRWIGNAVEVNESIDVLQGRGPDDLREVTLELGADLLISTGLVEARSAVRPAARASQESPALEARSAARASQESPALEARSAVRPTARPTAIARLQAALDGGDAMERFEQMVDAQGGDLSAPRPLAPRRDVCSTRSGYVTEIDTEKLGYLIIGLGGGRKRKDDCLNMSVGLEMHVRLGDLVESGQPLATVLAANDSDHAAAARACMEAIAFSDSPPAPSPVILRRLV